MDSSSRRSRTLDVENGSAVESFYGRAAATRLTSYAPVEPEDDPFTPPSRNRRDSSSTFFGRNAMGAGDEHEIGVPRQSGGRSSLYGQPRIEPVKDADWEEDGGEPFDIYADFNNAGPRYSGAQNLNDLGKAGSGGYRTLGTPEGSKVGIDEAEVEPVELVTVPRFGPEWTKDELRLMTKKGRAEDSKFERQQRWREWNNNKRGLFGQKWLTRKVIVYTIFISVIITAVIVAIVIPRVPSFGFNPNAPLTSGKGTAVFTRGPPANFTFSTLLDLEMDTTGNVIPIHINNIHGEIYSTNTQKQIAAGDSGGFWRRPGAAEPLSFPMEFNYSADNDSDTTWNLMYNACKASDLYGTGSRPGLNIVLILRMDIRGLLHGAAASTSIDNLACPIQLPSNV